MFLTDDMKILKESISEPDDTYSSDKGCHIQITELHEEAELKTVTIDASKHDNWFSFNPDERRKCKNSKKCTVMSPLLEKSLAGYHCACDCVIILKKEKEIYVLYIDLKSSKTNRAEKTYASQAKSTRQFVRYLIGLANEFFSVGIDINNINERYIVIYRRVPINKTTTKPDNDKIKRSSPNAPYYRPVFNKETLYLNEFL
jgi:hypothetical protein